MTVKKIIPSIVMWTVGLCLSVQAGQTPQNSPASQLPGPFPVMSSRAQLLSLTPGKLTFNIHSAPDASESPPMLKEKSRGRAFLFSILLPGAGQYYVGHKHRARNFLISEILLWTTYAGFRTYGNWVKNDYQVYAATHAEANISGKDHRYFVAMGNYDNIYQYNEAQRNQRELEEVYPENSRYFWDWDSEARRHKFEKLRLTSDTAYNRAELTIGAIIAHHLLSAIDAVWMTNKYNKKLRQSGLNLRIEFSHQTPHNHILITLSRSF
ncbi:MAG: hypothetical protein ONB05_05190 [candidate division KSB1 bacterium]|nr:hypothetical protein [candidate division KSB1 bacterium]